MLIICLQLHVYLACREPSQSPHFGATGCAHMAPTRGPVRLPPQIAKRVCLASMTTTSQQPPYVRHARRDILQLIHSVAKERALSARTRRRARSTDRLASRAEQALLMQTTVQPPSVLYVRAGTSARAHSTARGVLPARTLSQSRRTAWLVQWAA